MGNERDCKKGLQEGIEQGLEQGREEGEQQKALETARNLLNMGLSIEQIVQATSLSIEEVIAIQTQLNSDSE